jgi:hypothetical protein
VCLSSWAGGEIVGVGPVMGPAQIRQKKVSLAGEKRRRESETRKRKKKKKCCFVLDKDEGEEKKKREVEGER